MPCHHEVAIIRGNHMNMMYAPQRFKRIRTLFAAGLLLATVCSAVAEEGAEFTPLEPPDTSSPRATLFGFIADVNQAFGFVREAGRSDVSPRQARIIAQRINRHLDRRKIPEHIMHQAGTEAAMCLKEVLDRVPIPDPEDVPGPGDESLPGRWRLPGTDIVIERMTDGPFQDEYLFSAHTVASARSYFEYSRTLPLRTEAPPVTPGLFDWFTTEPATVFMARIVDRLPRVFRTTWGNHTLWQWAGLAVTLLVGLGLMSLAYRIGSLRAGRFRGSNSFRYFVTLIFPVTATILPMVMKYVVRKHLILAGQALRITDFVLGLIALFAIMGLIWAFANRVMAVVLSAPRFRPKTIDAHFVRLVMRVLSIIVVVVVFLEGGQRLGIPLSTLLAGAGIGGFAIAMAAQDSLKNVIGSMMIILDKPYQVGDRILAKKFDGVVTEIGLRSTKLNLLTGHTASIPNEEMAKTEIENIAQRSFIKRVADLQIPLDTSHAKLGTAIEIVENLLKDHEGMSKESPPRVYFTDIGGVGFNIRMIYWYAPPAYWDYLAFGHKLNLDIFRLFEEHGISFSLPHRLTPTNMDGTEPLDAWRALPPSPP